MSYLYKRAVKPPRIQSVAKDAHGVRAPALAHRLSIKYGISMRPYVLFFFVRARQQQPIRKRHLGWSSVLALSERVKR